MCSNVSCISVHREKLAMAASDAMAPAANAAKGGFVREALVNAFPRLALLMEEALAKLQRDTTVSFFYFIRLEWKQL